MRWILFLVAVAGCSQPTPVDTIGDVQPVVAVGGAYGVMSVRAKPIDVLPSKCANCGGTGYVGDGKIRRPCPLCNKGAK